MLLVYTLSSRVITWAFWDPGLRFAHLCVSKIYCRGSQQMFKNQIKFWPTHNFPAFFFARWSPRKLRPTSFWKIPITTTRRPAFYSFSHSFVRPTFTKYPLWPGTGPSMVSKMAFPPLSLYVGGGDCALGRQFIDFQCKDQVFCSSLFYLCKIQN